MSVLNIITLNYLPIYLLISILLSDTGKLFGRYLTSELEDVSSTGARQYGDTVKTSDYGRRTCNKAQCIDT